MLKTDTGTTDTGTRRALVRAGKREKLIRAGMSVVLEKGLQNTSVEDITKAAGVAKGTFYYYFPSKESFMVCAIEGVYRDAAFQEAQKMGTTAERIRTYLTQYARIMDEEIGLDFGRIWGQLVIQYKNTDRYQIDVAQVRDLLQRGVEEKELLAHTDCEALAKLFVTYIYGAAFEWHMGGKENDVTLMTALLCPYLDRILAPHYRKS